MSKGRVFEVIPLLPMRNKLQLTGWTCRHRGKPRVNYGRRRRKSARCVCHTVYIIKYVKCRPNLIKHKKINLNLGFLTTKFLKRFSQINAFRKICSQGDWYKTNFTLFVQQIKYPQTTVYTEETPNVLDCLYVFRWLDFFHFARLHSPFTCVENYSIWV